MKIRLRENTGPRATAGPVFVPRSRSPEAEARLFFEEEESAGRACSKLRKQLKTRADFHREQTPGREPASQFTVHYILNDSFRPTSFFPQLPNIN